MNILYTSNHKTKKDIEYMCQGFDWCGKKDTSKKPKSKHSKRISSATSSNAVLIISNIAVTVPTVA